MKDKIIPQLLDVLRASPLQRQEALTLVLQALAWTKLSSTGVLPEELRLSSDLLNDQARIPMVLSELERVDRSAFGVNIAARIEPIMLRALLAQTLRADEAGVLNNAEADDVITLMQTPGWETGIPPEVASLMIGLAQLHESDSLYTPWDFGGQLAARGTRTGASAYLETPMPTAIPALISLLGERPFETRLADPIRDPSAIENGLPRKFNVAVSFPPIGMRYDMSAIERDWYNRFPERSSLITVLSVRHLLSQASRRVVIAVSNGLLFGSGAELHLRKDLLQRGMVQAVIGLPTGLLPFANVAFSLVILAPAGGHDKVRFVSGDSPQFTETLSKARNRLKNIDALAAEALAQDDSSHSATVTTAEVLDNDAQLQVSRYVLPEAQKRLQEKLRAAPRVALGNCIDTIRPVPTTTENAEDEIEAIEIGASDLPSFGYIGGTGRTVRVSSQVARKCESQFLRPHDIVLIVKGSVGKLGIVPPDVPPAGEGGWIAGQSAIVLRAIPQKSDARALYLQLRSPVGQELLRSRVSGATIQLIQLKELLRLEILVQDKESEQLAIAALEREASLQRDIDQLREEQAQAAANIWTLN